MPNLRDIPEKEKCPPVHKFVVLVRPPGSSCWTVITTRDFEDGANACADYMAQRGNCAVVRKVAPLSCQYTLDQEAYAEHCDGTLFHPGEKEEKPEKNWWQVASESCRFFQLHDRAHPVEGGAQP